MRLFKVIVVCSFLFGCTPGENKLENPGFVSDRVEKSRESASKIDLAINVEKSTDSLEIGFIATNSSHAPVEIQYSSSYPLILIYAEGEMIQPSPEILDELVIFDDLEISRIGAQESKLIKEMSVKKPSEGSFQLRGYMAYKMEREDSLYNELHSITDEKVVER